MASSDEASRPTSPPVHDDSFPQYPHSHVAGPPSIDSSRMTDIASEDGRDTETARGTATASQRRSGLHSDAASRPGTARTGVSSNRPHPLRRGPSGHRASLAGSLGSASASSRPLSSASRSHVPSLTSHAFFHPMNAQKLQAQRGIMRPSTMRNQHSPTEDLETEASGSNPRHSIISNINPVAHLAQRVSNDGDQPAPPSRGTEMTEQGTFDHITANTSPTQGHYPTASVTESVTPLHRNRDRASLTIGTDRHHGHDNAPPPVTPRSFRSSFLIPGRLESGQTGFNRDIQGGEKLDSVASSPRVGHRDGENRSSSRNEKSASPSLYNYQHFEGNTIFCLGGRLQNTRHQPVNIATGLGLVVPCVLFFIFCAPWIWYNISPAIPITFGYLLFLSLSSFLHASGSDPGILPRNLHQFPEPGPDDDPLRPAPPTNDWTLVKSADKSVAAMEVPTKYCKTCNIWRPPRAHHCRLCDNCIETQDHHCVWLNNCIGRRNYRYFFTFLTTTTLIALYLVGACLAQILLRARQDNTGFGGALQETKHRVALALVVYGAVGGLYPAALMGYHLFLMARGETTREYLNSHKFLKKDRYRAFTQGSWFRNWFAVLCRPRTPTYYRFKNRFTEGDQRLGLRRDLRRQAELKEELEMQNVKRQDGQLTAGFEGPVAVRSGNTPARGS